MVTNRDRYRQTQSDRDINRPAKPGDRVTGTDPVTDTHQGQTSGYEDRPTGGKAQRSKDKTQTVTERTQ